MSECRKCYQRLREQDRTDLIIQYIKPLTALGLLDEEIEAAQRYGEQFDSFEKSNYLEQLEKAMNPDNNADEERAEGGGRSWNSL